MQSAGGVEKQLQHYLEQLTAKSPIEQNRLIGLLKHVEEREQYLTPSIYNLVLKIRNLSLDCRLEEIIKFFNLQQSYYLLQADEPELLYGSIASLQIDKWGNAPLYDAIRCDNKKLIACLRKKGWHATTKYNLDADGLTTTLHQAALMQDIETVQKINPSPQDLLLEDEDGEVPWQLAINKPLANFAILDLLVPINAWQWQCYAICDFLEATHLQNIRPGLEILLKKYSCNINAINHRGHTPLYQVLFGRVLARYSMVEMLRVFSIATYLISQGANINLCLPYVSASNAPLRFLLDIAEERLNSCLSIEENSSQQYYEQLIDFLKEHGAQRSSNKEIVYATNPLIFDIKAKLKPILPINKPS